MPKKSNNVSYNGKGISIVIKNDVKPCEKPKPKRKRKTNKSNNNFLDRNNNQIVDSKIPIYRDASIRNINNIPQPPIVDWQGVRLGLLPPPPAQEPRMIEPPKYTFNMPEQPNAYEGMAKLMDAMKPLFLTNNPYNTEYNGNAFVEEYVSQTNNEDVLLQQQAKQEAEDQILNESINAEEDINEEELQKRKEKREYEILLKKVSKFSKGRLKAGGTLSSSKLNKPAYIFNEEYMNSYLTNLENVKEILVENLGEKEAQLRTINEKIKLETDNTVKNNLKDDKKKIIKAIQNDGKRYDKIIGLEDYIQKEQEKYKYLFGEGT